MEEKKSSPAYKLIYSDLYGAIISGVYKPGDQLPIEVELCKKYGVSRITVQKALKGLVDEKIITRTIGKGTFVSDPSKDDLKSKPLIGVVLCSISPAFGTELLKSIEKNARINGYSVVFKNSEFNQQLEIEAIKDLMNLGVSGLILQPTHCESANSAVMDLTLTKKPLVLVDRNLLGITCPFVGSDNYSATKKVMNYLFLKGHRNISFMCSSPDTATSIQQRVDAFKTSFQEADVPYQDYFLFSDITFTLSLIDLERKMVEEEKKIKDYILAHPDITCIFTLEYSICLLVKKVLAELGPSYQQRVSLVTFDFISDPHMVSDVAYVRQYEDEMGFQAVRLVANALRGYHENSLIYLPTEFVNASLIKDLTRK
jgi:GntR family transcriptional regulator of arabinose operon